MRKRLLKFNGGLKKRRKLKKSGFPWWKVITVLTTCFVVGGVIYFIPKIIKIRVNEITCSNQYGACDKELLETFQKLTGKELVIVKDEIRGVLSNNIIIDKYLVSYRFPDKLEINVIEKKPLFAVKTSEGFYLVSKNGTILKKTDFTNLPVIELAVGGYTTGAMVDDNVLFSLEIVREMSSYYSVKNSLYGENVVKVQLKDGPLIIFPSSGDIQLLIGSANLVLLELNSGYQDTRIDNRKPVKSVDLRYKNPVLKY